MTLLKPLLYFSLFRYPLTEEEVFTYSEASSKEEAKQELECLVKDNVIYRINGFYLCEDDASLIDRRLKGNKKAREVYAKAERVSRLISRFPYVEGVGISGSLSKGYFDENGDIDFFVITSKKRLWIARTLLILYKKIFLLNSKKYFCVNYFISTNALEIDEKNRFTATELLTLIPMFGNGSFHEFYQKNRWVNSYLPNKPLNERLTYLNPVKKPLITKFLEFVLNNRFGDYLDTLFLRITYRKWQVKFKKFNQKQFNIAMKSTKNVSKHHPMNFQRRVIDRLNEKYEEYQKNHNIRLAKEHA